MTAQFDFHSAYAALVWQIELGADEAIGEMPVNRFTTQGYQPKLKITPNSNIALPSKPLPTFQEPVAAQVAEKLAAQAETLDSLRNAMATFEHCALKKGARNLVFADGQEGARVMVIGEAPGRDEDIQGKPFVGRAGQLLDKMFAAIGLDRDAKTPANGLYISNVVPWRPPQNRDPEKEEIAMMLPFLQRHIALVDPEVIVLMGNTACRAVLDKVGITRMRGNWHSAFDRPVMPMFHPAALLRDPLKKRDAWADLLAIKARLADGS